MCIVRSPLPSVSVAASNGDVIAPLWSGNSDLPFGVALEDSIEGQLLVDGTDGSSSDAGSKFKFEYFTDDFTDWQASHVSFIPTFGRFDSTIVSWDSQELGRDDYPESEPKTFDQPY